MTRGRMAFALAMAVLSASASFAQNPPTQALQAPPPTQAAASPSDDPDPSSWGALDASGTGFLIGRTKYGEMRIGGYALVRYINQLPPDQTFTDHLGNVNTIDTRNDVQFHRVKIDFRGWLGSPELRYQITAWSVMSTNQTTLYGFVGYRFHKAFNAYGHQFCRRHAIADGLASVLAGP